MSSLESIENQIKALILERYGSIPKFAARVGLSSQTVYSALNASLVNSKATTVMRIANEFDFDPFELMEGRLITWSGGSKDVPLLGKISAGTPNEPTMTERTFPVPSELIEVYPHAYLLEVDGESVNRIIPNGWYALISPCKTVEKSGELYAVAVGSQLATIKEVRVLSNGYELLPNSDDPTYKPIVFDRGDSEAEPVTVLGKVVWFCPPLDWSTNR